MQSKLAKVPAVPLLSVAVLSIVIGCQKTEVPTPAAAPTEKPAAQAAEVPECSDCIQ